MKTHLMRTYKNKYQEYLVSKVGNICRELRLKNKVTQQQLANEFKLHPTAIHYFEVGLMDTATIFLKYIEKFVSMNYFEQFCDDFETIKQDKYIKDLIKKVTGFSTCHIYQFFNKKTNSLFMLILCIEISLVKYHNIEVNEFWHNLVENS